ncbi:MAG: stage II sporulation protein M [Candidatus Hadarchaeum sp.]
MVHELNADVMELLDAKKEINLSSMSNTKRALSDALSRNSAAISFITLSFLTIMFLCTAYFLLSFDREQFINLPEVKEYDNLLENVMIMDEWSRTKFYWVNNLKVASTYATAFPIYTGTASILLTSRQIGLALVYNYHLHGPIVLLTFMAVIFLHGTLELTGAFIVGAASLRLGWKFWSYLGQVLATGSWKTTKRGKAVARKYLVDYIILVALGLTLITIAAPIEAYLSPSASVLFLISPLLAIFFLAVVMFFFVSIIKAGFNPMLSGISLVMKDAKMLASGRWRPNQLPLLTFILFFLLTWLGLLS